MPVIDEEDKPVENSFYKNSNVIEKISEKVGAEYKGVGRGAGVGRGRGRGRGED